VNAVETTSKPGNELTGHSGNDEIMTPRGLFDWLNRRFLFDYDAFASHENTLRAFYSTETGTFEKTTSNSFWMLDERGGLNYPWADRRVFLNPPYSQPLMGQAIEKCIEERNNAQIIVGLFKFDPSTANGRLLMDERYFHLEPQPRIKYGGMKSAATFASAIVIAKPDVWRPGK
jgi:hypothetical protein